jgi:hypothetical protein|tara:strand:+ start:100 stop:363 length:264 start_codon:yes stop_codon:yes gene_type:complete
MKGGARVGTGVALGLPVLGVAVASGMVATEVPGIGAAVANGVGVGLMIGGAGSLPQAANAKANAIAKAHLSLLIRLFVSTVIGMKRV